MSHHKVHLFDELLERLIFFCLCDGSLDSLLDGIVALRHVLPTFRQRPSVRDEKEIYKVKKAILRNFNDSWVDTKLVEAYERIEGLPPSDLVNRRLLLHDGLSERRDSFKSLFKRDEDYHERFNLDAKQLETFPEAATVATLVRNNKYVWEIELSDRNKPVVVGDLFSKLRVGVKNSAAAKFFGLDDMVRFLESKFQTSLPFNVWYFSESGLKETETEQKIVDFFQNRLFEPLRSKQAQASKGR